MSSDTDNNSVMSIKTPDLASCGEGENTPTRLFRVMTGIPIDYAIEQSSVLMNCVHRLTFVGVMEKDDTLVWAAHLLSGLSRALVDDVGHGIAYRARDQAQVEKSDAPTLGSMKV
ncbi:MAG TPA: DUF3077 domain-containing protein [Pseudomonas sp.]|uniref:DUF3077 domain-containing protein n=1 Tax=Pseudomonas sp. TaxID=306 RepID=UPI002B470F99|nr:DUF3077 domain-containing protein [Pseudomonas sp.]HKS12568.1 DUF3077 domain-containing protein [Pseudomonas sp.]